MKTNGLSSLMNEIKDLPFTKGYDFSDIYPYLSFIESEQFSFSSTHRAYLTAYFKEVIELLNSKLNKIHRFIAEKSNEQIKNFQKNTFIRSENMFINEENRIVFFLKEEKEKYQKVLMKCYQKNVSAQINLVQKLLLLCNYLVEHPHPIWINFQCAFPNIESTTFFQKHDLHLKINIINAKIQEKLNYIEAIPKKLFSVVENNKCLINKAIEIALSYKKPEINYFEELPIEETLYSFFESKESPFHSSKLFPLNINFDKESVLNWLSKAKDVLFQYDPLINTEEKAFVIDIFLTRFIFNNIYSSIPLSMPNSFELNQKLKEFSQCTPEKMNVVHKYIPKESINEPIWKLFKHSTISSAPIEWLQLTQFKVCPIDAAFCLSKAHESITIMATLEATKNALSETTKDFFKKIPGFDDIFGLWNCLLCSAELPDPEGLYNYLNNWCELPGFCNRFLASFTYLEASLVHLKDLE